MTDQLSYIKKQSLIILYYYFNEHYVRGQFLTFLSQCTLMF